MSPEIPGSAGRRAGSMQNPGEETGWARCGAGPCAPRPPQTPAPTRTPQHPGVHLPSRGCCRTTALRGHPPRYVPATPAAILITVPTAGPRGEPVSLALPRALSPSTGRGGAGGLGLQHVCPVAAQRGPAPAPRFVPLSPPVPRCPQRGSRHVRAEPPRPLPAQRRWPRRARPAPGDRGVGNGALGAARGVGEDAGLPRECGGCVTPRGSDRAVPAGWGAASDCFRDPTLGLFDSVSFQLRSDPLGNPSVLLQMFSLC